MAEAQAQAPANGGSSPPTTPIAVVYLHAFRDHAPAQSRVVQALKAVLPEEIKTAVALHTPSYHREGDHSQTCVARFLEELITLIEVGVNVPTCALCARVHA